MTAVCNKSVGLVLAIEASRLSRSGSDWHLLLEFCAIVGCLVGDRERLYDPAVADDRAYLGIKGQFSDMEQAIFRQRSLESREALAARGELFLNLPAGYEKTDTHHIARTPDQHQRDAIDLVFRMFRELRSIRQVYLWFRDRGLEIPVRGPGRDIVWRVPGLTLLHPMLGNPIYAGAYVYGRRRQEVTIANGRKQLRKGIMKATDEWTVLLHDRHEGYIDWEEYERNRAMIEANTVGNRGAPGGGRALQAGLVRCGHCQRRMQVRDNGKAVGYSCPGTSGTGGPACITFGAVRVDEAVRDAVLRAVQPLGVAAALEAFETRDADAMAEIRLAGSALEQARYRAARAQSQFDSVDPDNHNVFHNLAARWEACLEEVRSCEERLQDLESAELQPPTVAERDAWLALGADLERAWSHDEATPQLRKNIVRAALVEITASLRERHVHLLLHWQGGDHTEITVRRNRTGEHRYKTDRQTDDLITDLARNLGDASIAGLLNRLGKKTSKGNSWNKDRVRAFRSRRRIAAYRDGERRERNELVLSEVAARLDVDPSAVRRLIAVGLLPARQVCKGAPWIIDAGDLDSPRIAAALAGRRIRVSNPRQAQFAF